MSSKLSPRQKQKLFRYAQYALLAVIAGSHSFLADWKTLSQQAGIQPDVAGLSSSRRHHCEALKNTPAVHHLGLIGPPAVCWRSCVFPLSPPRWIATLYGAFPRHPGAGLLRCSVTVPL